MEKQKKEHILSLLVNNKPDVLARVAGTLGGRGYNIDTLCVDATLDPKISKIILSVYQDQAAITKIEKQLLRLIDVHSVSELTETETVMREMMLVRMRLTEKNKADIALIIDTFRGRVVTMNGDSCVIEITGTKADIERAIESLKPLGIDDLARTGIVALERIK
ncbi:MAG TPA: acetolactate synthase small subunit [Syntrophales bacterium]|nr:acetolactate synthase small subunit [Syntrophobacterales bacterium]HRR39862.1 acetolactate synthase small subunit [Syntrophales bacterium]HRT26638.1 acetolactate synthase small subunit [Syntrophales bacterium]HRT69745.1 acetolactate synthase small subunit [Syntrophales bacterium]